MIHRQADHCFDNVFVKKWQRHKKIFYDPLQVSPPPTHLQSGEGILKLPWLSVGWSIETYLSRKMLRHVFVDWTGIYTLSDLHDPAVISCRIISPFFCVHAPTQKPYDLGP